MDNTSSWRPIFPPGDRMPDPKVRWKLKDPELDRKRKEQLDGMERFVPKPHSAPTKCPLCGTEASDYRAEHNGEELLRPGGHPFVCAVCGNTEWE